MKGLGLNQSINLENTLSNSHCRVLQVQQLGEMEKKKTLILELIKVSSEMFSTDAATLPRSRRPSNLTLNEHRQELKLLQMWRGPCHHEG